MILPLISNDPRVSVGEFTYGNPRLLLWSENERIQIGKFCSIAEEAVIFGGGEHNTHWVTTYPMQIAFDDPLVIKDGPPATKGPTIIGHDVWLGLRTTVLSGVTIGHGAVVGAGTVVTRNIPPYTMVGGNPGKVIRQRFTDAQVCALLEIKWWDWPLAQIRQAIPLFCSADIGHFIAQAKLHGT